MTRRSRVPIGTTAGTAAAGDHTHATLDGIVRDSSAILVYDGAPAAGTLVASLAATAGTDRYGNAYPLGLSLPEIAGFGAGSLQWQVDGAPAQPSAIYQSSTGNRSLVIHGIADTNTDTGAGFLLSENSGSGGQVNMFAGQSTGHTGLDFSLFDTFFGFSAVMSTNTTSDTRLHVTNGSDTSHERATLEQGALSFFDSSGVLVASYGTVTRLAHGATGSRPAGLGSSDRVEWFDDTVGKPIWWNGTGWVDAAGAAV